MSYQLNQMNNYDITTLILIIIMNILSILTDRTYIELYQYSLFGRPIALL